MFHQLQARYKECMARLKAWDSQTDRAKYDVAQRQYLYRQAQDALRSFKQIGGMQPIFKVSFIDLKMEVNNPNQMKEDLITLYLTDITTPDITPFIQFYFPNYKRNSIIWERMPDKLLKCGKRNP